MAVCSLRVLGGGDECPLDEVGASLIVEPGVYGSIGTVIDAAGVLASEELLVSLGEMLGVSGPSPVGIEVPGKPPSSDISWSLSANDP